MKLLLIFSAFAVIFMASSCKKPLVLSKDNLTFSNDTVIFDTIFTTVGSTTKRLKLYNNSSLPVLVEDIELMGGANSPFNLNLDGVSGSKFSAIQMPKNDSLFMFVEVTLSVNNGTLPMVVEDSIRFRTNGVDQYVSLVVWGQDAYFHVNEIVSDNEPWQTDKPHVIYGIAAVGFPGIDSNLTLTIPAGAQIYAHKRSFLYVYKSTVNINGTLGNEVVFLHDRLEAFYDDNPGQWGGIWLQQANNSTINYAIIRNAEIGLRADTTSGNLTLAVKNTFIDNSQFYNLFLNAGPIAQFENTIFGKAGIISSYLFAGGEAQFKHCNFTNYWLGSRGGPAFAIKNYYVVDDITYVRPYANTRFDNCVMYGNGANEIVVDTLIESPALFDVVFRNCVMLREADEIYEYPNFIDIIWRENPLFKDVSSNDYTFEDGSPLNNAGNNLTGVATDIAGNSRNMATPDIGAYEN
ncbi:MAG: choice-of-anchor Q domain-containing protein [Putridiphycobacter sp.]|nr:choice-of-anchor Q domain-containing protein [Putridiphycobacter sp.]